MIQGVIERYEDDQLVVSGAVAAKIQPGRCDARQALACICEEPRGEIRRFVKPDR